MFELFEKSLNLLSKKAGIVICSGKVYRKNSFALESSRLFVPQIQNRYEELIESYPHPDDRRKAKENQALFVEMAFKLGLESGESSYRILDIGSRGGLFPFICNSYGHAALATDLEEVLEKSPNSELLELFGVESRPLRITPFKKIPDFGERFDLVTGFRTRFHSRYPWETGEKEERHWGIKEWDYLLKDLALNHTMPDARIFFMLNRLQERHKGRLMPKSHREYFLTMGAKIHYSYLYFPDLSRLRR